MQRQARRDDVNSPTAGTQGRPAPVHPRDHFLRLMFFQASRDPGQLHDPPFRGALTGEYVALPHLVGPGQRYALPLPNTPAAVRLDSPAVEVMTDLRRVEAVSIERLRTLDEAKQAMIARHVRALFVTDDAREVFGIITATDLQGEAPVRAAQSRGIHYDEVLVRDVMTPADRLEVLAMDEVQRARVGDILATLKAAGRQHALAVEPAQAGSADVLCVRGIFSLTQIARQLGVSAQPVNDIARTFAEIEAAIGS